MTVKLFIVRQAAAMMRGEEISQKVKRHAGKNPVHRDPSHRFHRHYVDAKRRSRVDTSEAPLCALGADFFVALEDPAVVKR